MIKNKTYIINQLKAHKSEIVNFGARQIGLFGSYVRNQQTSTSDIDFVVEFEEGQKKYKNLAHLSFFLEELFKQKIELVTLQSLAPFVKKNIENEIEYVDFSH